MSSHCKFGWMTDLSMHDPESLVRRVAATIEHYRLIGRGKTVLCAVSGGPDSVAMVYLLHELSGEMGFRIQLAHVNYRTRGADSEAEEVLCRRIADELNVKAHFRVVTDRDRELLKSGNFQRNARDYRLDFFHSVAAETEASRIAVGHTEDDVVETSLMHIIRGSGISGAAGIFPKSGLVVRPVIECRKSDLVDYLNAAGRTYLIDRSNESLDYARNRVRNSLIPYFQREFNPQIVESVSNLAKSAREVSAYIDAEVSEVWRKAVSTSRLGKIVIEIGDFLKTKNLIQTELIRRAYRGLSTESRNAASLDRRLVENAIRLTGAGTGARADLKEGVSVERGAYHLIVFKRETAPFEAGIEVPGTTVMEQFNLEVDSEITDNANVGVYSSDNWAVFLNSDCLERTCVIRNWKAGDRVHLLGAPGRKKVSDIFTDRKIPRALRMEIPLLVSRGEIIWIAGIGVAEEAKVTGQTDKVVKLDARAHVIQDEDSGRAGFTLRRQGH